MTLVYAFVCESFTTEVADDDRFKMAVMREGRFAMDIERCVDIGELPVLISGLM
jgi:hypothetical protein